MDITNTTNTTSTTPLFSHFSPIQQLEMHALHARMKIEYIQEMLTAIWMVTTKLGIFTAKADRAQDYVRKLLLLEHFKHVGAYDIELSKAISDAIRDINQWCLDAVKTSYSAEVEEVKQAESEFDAGLLSQTDYERRLSDIERQTDEAVRRAEKCAEECYGSLPHHNTFATTMELLTGETATKH